MPSTPRPAPIPPFELAVTISGDRAEMALAGDIDIANADQIESAAYHYLGEPHIAHVTADLNAVTFLDSSGLRALTHSRRRAAELGKTFRIQNHHDHIAKVIEITGLTRYLTDPTYSPGTVSAGQTEPR